MKPDLLLIGAGDLGTEIGLRFAASEHGGVVAVRRRAEFVPAPVVGVSGDIADGLPDALPEFAGVGGGPRFLVICLTAGGRDESNYRATFLDGVTRVLADVERRGWRPERAVFVSSTGVCAPEGEVTEETPPRPSSPTSVVLLDAEHAFLGALPAGTRGVVVRPSGLYGPGREWFIDQVRGGELSNPQRMTHRVHRDDVARAVVHLLTMSAEPQELYLVTDDAPAPAHEVAAFVAETLGVAPDPASSNREPRRIGLRAPNSRVESTNPNMSGLARGDEGAAPDTRRLRNTRLRASGFTFLYPTYREGYAAVIGGEGEHHP